MKWRQANKIIARGFNRYRKSTWRPAVKKGSFPTGYLGVSGRYSKRYPKGADRSALNCTDLSAIG